MDDKVKELLDRIRDTAAGAADAANQTARAAGKRAGQMVDVAKLNVQLFDLNGEFNDILRQMGQVMYDAHRGQREEGDKVSELLERADGLSARISDLKERISALRQSPPAARYAGKRINSAAAAAPDCERERTMNFTMEQYQESAQALRARLGGFVPKVAMVLGSGLGYLGDEVEDPIAVDYRDIPHFKASTAPGHKGRLVEGQRGAVMQGRMHHYEGYSYEEVSYAVRVLRLLGCDTLVVTNAAGCVNLEWKAGDLMLITDQIKMFSESPLRGENLPEFGVRFPDASHLYTPRLRELARETAAELDIPLREGVYFYCYGPQYETPAEIRAARILGGDAVGMSTAPEVIMAGHCGMEVLGLTLLSNMAAGILDQPLSEQEVLDAAAAAREKFSGLIRACLKKM